MIERLDAWNVAKWPSLTRQRGVAKRLSRAFRALRDERVDADYYIDDICASPRLRDCIERAVELGRTAAQLKIAINSAQESELGPVDDNLVAAIEATQLSRSP
ncbi:hypothetical protein [Tahibacter sp.]|uniref:hypothetical protein n=1 Tax=Tahibacter sp. TaxID=2056211 RepID=UPI0028C4AA3F|nr:hypothetical protein [Tahibacter sp.]